MRTENFATFLVFLVMYFLEFPKEMDGYKVKPKYPIPYYWRRWTGTIPRDAVCAGYRDNWSGDKIYMGQAVCLRAYFGLQPVAIYENSTYFEYLFEKRNGQSKQINILCASSQNDVRWETMDRISQKNLVKVIAGTESEPDRHTHFGRTVYKGETQVGKVVNMKGTWTFYFVYGDSYRAIVDNYEVLVHA